MADGTLIFDTKLDTTGVKTGLSTLGTFGAKAFGVLKTAAMAVTTATVGIGVAASNVGAEFEAEMSKVAAISGAAGDELDALTKKAEEMGAKTKFSASESAQAFEYMAMAGWKPKEMLEGIDGVMALAAASGEDLALTSDIVTDALTAMGYSAGEAGHLADVMAAASSNANTNVAMMGETFKYAASVAGAYGYSMEDIALATGLMANSGIKASQAGTSLRSIFTRLATDAGASANKLGALGTLTQELGVEFYNTDGTMRDLSDVLAETRVAWKGLNQEEAANYANTIAGKNALTGWLALMNASEEDFKKLSSAINECNGAAQDMADTMMDNLQGQITILKSALEGLGIKIYGELETPLKDTVKVLNNIVAAMSEGFEGNVGNGGIIGMIRSGATAISEALTDLANNTEIYTFIKTLTYNITTGLAEIIPAALDAGIMIFNAIMDGLGNAASENTFFEAARNISSKLASAFINNLDTIIKIGIEILAGLGQGLMDALPLIAEKAPQIIATLATSLSKNAPQLLTLGLAIIGSNLLPGLVGNAAQALISKAGSTVLSLIGSALSSGLSAILPALLSIGSTIISTIGAALSAALPVLIALAPVILGGLALALAAYFFLFTDTGKDIVAKIGDGIKVAWDWLKEKVSEYIDVLVDVFTMKFKIFQAIGQFLVDGFTQGWGTAWENFKTTVSNLLKNLLDDICKFFGIHSPSTVFADIGRNLILGLINGVVEIWNTLMSTVSTLITNLINNFMSFVSNFMQIGATYVNSIVTFFSDGWAKFVGSIGTLVDNLVNGFMSLAKNVWDIGTKYIDGLGKNLNTAWNNIVKSAGTLIKNLANAFNQGVKAFGDIGKNIVNGLWSGISNGWKWLTDKVKGLAKDLLNAAKDALGIHSPSKEFEKIGQNCVAGFDKGSEDLMSGDVLTKGINASLDTIKINAAGAAIAGGNTSTYNQTIVVNDKISTPDELARAVRLESKYGLMRGVALA